MRTGKLMKLVQMAYLELTPPPDFDTPGLTLAVEDTEVDWVARWANPDGPWNTFRKLERLRAAIRYPADRADHAVVGAGKRTYPGGSLAAAHGKHP
jgi:hypothetical protein